ncbi:MAG TPA: sigma-70 family RNA polymerase sigma factor [Firmicutes bacterium]|nr:sigma-70 family RNA polymerase sigma factor [Bacillota bacterium]
MGHKQDREQFMELLFKQNYNRIYQYCFLKLGPPPQDAEDCAMETFFRAQRQIDSLMRHPCPERWLYVTARNVSLEWNRERQKKKELEALSRKEAEQKAAFLEQEGLEAFFFAGNGQEDEYVRGLERELMDCLKPGELELYRLLVSERKSSAQIAELLCISRTNVTTRIFRLRKKLKKQLKLAERRRV